MGEPQSSSADFLRDVAKDVAVATVLSLLATVGIQLGLGDSAAPLSPNNWPLILAASGCFIVLLLTARMLRVIARRRTRVAVGQASGDRIAILLPRLVGDDVHGTKRETIRERIKGQLGEAVELLLWPEALGIAEGRDDDAERQTLADARHWLAMTHCDVIVWGRLRGDRVLSLRVGGNVHRPYILDEDTLDLRPDFDAELTAMIVEQALEEGHEAEKEGSANVDRIRRVTSRIDAIADLVKSWKVTLIYAGLLARLGHYTNDRELVQRAVTMAIQLAQENSSNLTENDLFDVNSAIASMFLTISQHSLSRSVLGEALTYLNRAREISQVDKGDINYGILISIIGTRDMRRDLLETALSEFGAVVSDGEGVHDNDTIGKAWHNMGLTNERLFLLTCDRTFLDASIAALDIALEYRREHDAPIYWAKTRGALASALLHKAELERDSEYAHTSLKHLHASRKVYSAAGIAAREAEATYNIGCTLSALGALESSPKYLLAAVEELKLAESYWQDENDAHLMNVRNVLGSVYCNLAVYCEDVEFCILAADKFSDSLILLDKYQAPEQWLGVSSNLARCYIVRGVLTADSAPVLEARRILEECLTEVEQFGEVELAGTIRRHLADCYLKLSVLEENNSYIDEAILLHESALSRLTVQEHITSWAREKIGLGSLLITRAQLTGSVTDADAAAQVAGSTASALEPIPGRPELLAELAKAEHILEEAIRLSAHLSAERRRGEPAASFDEGVG